MPLPPRRAVYCSEACKRRIRIAKRTVRTPATCIGCGREFAALVSHMKRGGGKYCSTRCCANHAAATGRFAGANNPRWLGGVSNDNMRYRDRQKEREPIQEAARRALAREVRAGRITRQPCDRCGAERSEAHHDDYAKPLEVRWLCRAHHVEAHRELEAAGIDPMARARSAVAALPPSAA